MQLPEMITCDRVGMRLTKAGCSKLFLSAQENRPAPHEGRFHCLTCQVGAANAGVALAPTAEGVEAIRTLCPRCQERTDRLIKGRLCVSCYNRQREVLIGKNRKGGVPRLTRILHKRPILVVDNTGPRTVETDLVVSSAEAVFAMSHSAPGSVAFGWAPGGPRSPQSFMQIGAPEPRRIECRTFAPRRRRSHWTQLSLDLAA